VNFTQKDKVVKAFGKNLKRIRQAKQISQEELAYRCDIELSQIGRIERGVINTSISNVFLISEALGIEPKELFSFNSEE
jgi:transcriptional regulator with XRE-family HTH domain